MVFVGLRMYRRGLWYRRFQSCGCLCWNLHRTCYPTKSRHRIRHSDLDSGQHQIGHGNDIARSNASTFNLRLESFIGTGRNAGDCYGRKFRGESGLKHRVLQRSLSGAYELERVINRGGRTGRCD